MRLNLTPSPVSKRKCICSKIIELEDNNCGTRSLKFGSLFSRFFISWPTLRFCLSSFRASFSKRRRCFLDKGRCVSVDSEDVAAEYVLSSDSMVNPLFIWIDVRERCFAKPDFLFRSNTYTNNLIKSIRK